MFQIPKDCPCDLKFSDLLWPVPNMLIPVLFWTELQPRHVSVYVHSSYHHIDNYLT